MDFSSIRKKIHSPQQMEQLGLPLEEAPPKPSGLIDFSSIREEAAPKIIDSPTPTVPDHIQFTGNPFDTLLTPPVVEPPVVEPPVAEPKIREFIPSAEKGYAGLKASEGQ